MDPSSPSQPSLNTAYGQPSNPATQTPSEIEYSTSTSQRSGPTAEARKPNDIPVSSQHGHDATPSSLEQGARDASGDRGDEVSLWVF